MTQFSLAQNIHRKWGWMVAFGSLQILLGLCAIVFVGVTSLVSVLYLGVLFMIAGVTEIVYAIRNREHGDLWFHLLFGVLTSVCGFFIFNNPLLNLVVLSILLATLFMVTGIVTLVSSVLERFSNWGWFAVNGALSVFIGYYIFQNPMVSGIYLIGFLVGIQMFSRGLAWLSLGWSGRRLSTPRVSHA